jgi:MFS family permease
VTVSEDTEDAKADDDSGTGTGTSTGSLWRNRDYASWWLGETVSGFGSALSTFAYPVLILTATGSAAHAGIVGSAMGIGVLVTMLVGGALADRYSRRTILLAGPLLQSLAVGSVFVAVALGHVNLVHVAAVGLLQGIISGLTYGAERPALRRIVPAQQLPTAFSQMQGRDMATRLAGPPTGGLLFSLGRSVPFLGDALSYVAAAVGVFLIRRPLGPEPDERTEREPILASIRGGLQYIRADAYLRYLTVWTAGFNAIAGGMFLLVVVLVRARGGGPALIGAVTSIGAAGGLAGAFLSGRITRRWHGRTVVIALSWITAADFAAIGFVPKPWLIGVLLAFLLFLVAPINVIFATYETRMIPDELSGRVSSAIDFGASSLRWLGPLGAGLLASAIDPTRAMLVLTALVAVLAVSTHLARGLRVLDLPIDQVGPGQS